ncbi:hypothetical protein SERLA73DRAFT_47026, partial [Serpula lacrymans var. lacrymans S7.3]
MTVYPCTPFPPTPPNLPPDPPPAPPPPSPSRRTPRSPRPSSSQSKTHTPRPCLSIRPRTCFGLLKIALPVLAALTALIFIFYEPHLELVLYPRAWIQREIVPVLPLSGCFEPARVSAAYNVSQYVYGPTHTDVEAGMPMRMG